MNSKTVNNDSIKAVNYKVLKITSTAFTDGGAIPSKYTCDGGNISPALDIGGIPENTKCLAVIVDDPDAPIRPWVHWLAWDIHTTRHIKEGRMMEAEGRNDFGENKYSGPCPPSGIHHYYFKVYALDTLLNLPVNTSKTELEKAMSEHILAFGELIGTYNRQ